MRTNKTTIILVCLVVLIFSFIFYFSVNNSIPNNKNIIGDAQTNSPSPGILSDREKLLKFSKIIFPKTTSGVATSLPDDLSFFKLVDATNFEVLRTVYDNNKTGLSLSMDIDYPFRSANVVYNRLFSIGHKDWGILFFILIVSDILV